MILKDAQCTNYRLQSILEWAFNAAQSMGFDFNPTEIKRRTNVQWMYQALRNLHQRLSQVMLVNLEDHNNIQDVICFDFATSLLLLPQDNNLMQPENLVVNLDNPTSMYMPSEKKYGEAHTDKRYCMLFQELITSTKQLLVPRQRRIVVWLGHCCNRKWWWNPPGRIPIPNTELHPTCCRKKTERWDQEQDDWQVCGHLVSQTPAFFFHCARTSS